MTDVEKLIAESRNRTVDHARQNPEGSIDLERRLADALEATAAELRMRTWQFEDAEAVREDNARLAEDAEAERDRYYEGLYQVYVQLGEDTDGARNAVELFRPMTNTDPAEWVPRLVAEYRAEMERESDAIEAERDEARRWAEMTQAQKFEWEGKEAAVRAERDRYRREIEEARTHEWSSFGDSGTYRILTAALDETKED